MNKIYYCWSMFEQYGRECAFVINANDNIRVKKYAQTRVGIHNLCTSTQIIKTEYIKKNKTQKKSQKSLINVMMN